MSISSVSTNGLFELLYAQNNQTPNSASQSNTSGQNGPLQQIADDFTQLGQDLQEGNITQAQQDFTALSTALSSPANANGATANNPIQQAFTALQQDLQNGNLSGAQQDFSTLQGDLQQTGTQPAHHRHHGGSDAQRQQEVGAVSQDFNSLAQALQSGDLSGAQSAFTSLQNDLQQLSRSAPSSYSSSSPSVGQVAGSSLNVTA